MKRLWYRFGTWSAAILLAVAAVGCSGGELPGGDAGTAQPDGTDCVSGSSRVCGSSFGICEKGTQECVDGEWTQCRGSVQPKSEICDGKDNNCSGDTDELARCRGDSGVDGETDGGDTGPDCPGDAGPSTETCDGEDNDCDGSTDEGTLTPKCPKQEGVCSAATGTCDDGGNSSCDASDYGADYEVPETSCDMKDNDCDGTTDETKLLKALDFEESGVGPWIKFPKNDPPNADPDATSGDVPQGMEYGRTWGSQGICDNDHGGFAVKLDPGVAIQKIVVQVRVDLGDRGRAEIVLTDGKGNVTQLWLAKAEGNGYKTNGWKTLTFDRSSAMQRTTSSGAVIEQKKIPSAAGTSGEVVLAFGNDDNTSSCMKSTHAWSISADDFHVLGSCP